MELTASSFYKQLQKSISKLSIDITILRNQGPTGTVKNCQEFCEKLDLDAFINTLNTGTYKNYLDKKTKELEEELKEKCLAYYLDKKTEESKRKYLAWGSARKVLNIFF